MSDVNANIGVHIDTSAALAELKALQRQLANFHSSIAKNSAASVAAQKGLQNNLLNSINATGKFHASMGLVKSSTESFTHALEGNKLSMREYFRYAGGSTRTFGKLFKQEFDTIGKVAEQRVRKMQTQYIKMGRDANGAMKAMSITPNTINMKDYGTQVAVAAQKQALFNQLMKQGSTNLLNFGKNTQWAGRQLMVGFSVPLIYIGATASKVFMDLEAQAIKFKRVYGDMFTTTADTSKALAEIQLLAKEFTKYGVAVSKTMEMAASVAAMGKTGAELTAQVKEATRLSVLGNVEQQQALETTISLTNAFGISAEELATKIDFLNSVENQTVVSIEDLTIAIPKAGPVIKQLGGDVEDLAFFLTAMKEGGINASEGANALKSGLAAMINPTKKVSAMLAGFGINLNGIVEANKGDIKNTVIGFAQALDTLDPLNRARAIEQLFGKFQFARLSTLFQNITKDGSQASRVLDLAGRSVEELAIISERELKTVEDAVGTNFKESIEQLKLSLAPIGKTFLQAVTPVVKVVGQLLEKFNGLGDGTKKLIVIATTLLGVVGPALLMTFGLLANGAANIIKLFLTMRGGFLRLGGNTKILAEQTQYMSVEQLEAATAAASLNQAHTRLTQRFELETAAVRLLRQAYIDATIAGANFAMANPGMMLPGKGGKKPKKFASGVSIVPGTGNKDSVPSILTPGEAVIPKDVMEQPNARALVQGLIDGKLQGFNSGDPEVKKINPKDNITHVGKAEQVRIEEYIRETPQLTEYNKTRLRLSAALQKSQGILEPMTGDYRNLGFIFDKKMNIRLANSKGINLNSFLNEWDKKGPEKWDVTGKGKIEKNLHGTDNKIIDEAMRKEIEKRANKNNGMVTDDLVKDSFKNLDPKIKNLDQYKRMDGFLNQKLDYGTKSPLLRDVQKSKGILEKAAKGGEHLADVPVLVIDGDQLVPHKGKQVKLSSVIGKKGYPLPENTHVLLKRTNSHGEAVTGQLYLYDKASNKTIPMNKADGTTRASITGKPKEIATTSKTLDYFTGGTLGATKPAPAARQAAENNAKDAKNVNPQQEKSRSRLTAWAAGQQEIRSAEQAKAPSWIKESEARGARQYALVQKQGEALLNTKTGEATPLTTKNTKPKPTNAVSSSGNKSDTRLTSITPEQKVIKIPKKFRKIGRFILPGYGDAPSIGKLTAQQLTTEYRSRAEQIRETAKRLKVSEGMAKKMLAAEGKLMQSKIELTKATQAETQSKIKGQRSGNFGRVSGGIGTVAGMGAMAGYMTGNAGVGNAMMGVSAAATIAPMLANPWVATIAAIAVVTGALIKMAKDVENARKSGVDLAKSMNMTSEKLQGLGQITRTVSATEEADRKRQNILTGEGGVQRKFGQNILSSDFGKGLLADIEKQAKSGQGIQQIGKNISNSLAYAIVQGVITTDQAKSISAALGEELKSYEIPAIISGRLTNLLGPNGENLAKDPLKVTLAIQEESMTRQADYFKTALENIKPVVGLSPTKTILGATGAGALLGAGVGAFSGPLAPVTATGGAIVGGVLGAASGIGAALSEKGARENNAKLGAAALQLGLEQVTMNNGLVDSLNKQYDIKVKMAKTDDEIKTIEDERKAALDTLNAKNTEALNLLIAQKDAFGPDIFTKGINAAIDTLYKEGPMKVFADEAKKALEGIKDSDFKAMLQVEFASGSLDPLTIMKLANNKELQSQFTILVEQQGSENSNLIMQLLMKAGVSDTNLPIFMDIINKDPKNFDKNMNAIAVLANMKQKYGITIDMNDDGANQVEEVVAIIEKLKGIKDNELSKKAFFDLGITGNMSAEEMDKLWTTLVGTSSTINKSVVIDFVAAGDKNVLAAYLVSKGIKYQLKGRGAAAQKKLYMDSAKADLVGREGKAAKDKAAAASAAAAGKIEPSSLDALVQKMRDVYQANITLTTGWEASAAALKNLFKTGIHGFAGLANTLRKQSGANENMIDFILGMSAEEFEKQKFKLFGKNQNGTINYSKTTELFKLLNKSVDSTAVIGGATESNRKIIQNINDQASAVKKLTAAGIASDKALKIVEDQALATAIATMNIKEGTEQWNDFIASVKAAGSAIAMTRDQMYAKFNEGVSAASQYFDAQEALIVLEATPETDRLQKEIDNQNKVIDAQQIVVDGIQKEIDLKNEEIDVISRKNYLTQHEIDLNSDRIDQYQREVNNLQRVSDIKYGQPLEELQQLSDVASHNMSLIDHAAEAINTKYDLQAEALSKISELNSEIANQQRDQLDLADSLSRGDISGAARAAQTMRANAAAAAQGRASGTLEAARKTELSTLTAGGMSKDQITQEQWRISQDTYKLEQGRAEITKEIKDIQETKILPLERENLILQDKINSTKQSQWDLEQKIYDIQTKQLIPAQEKLDAAKAALQKKIDDLEKHNQEVKDRIDALEYLGKTRKGWEDIKIKVDAAYASLLAFEASMAATEEAAAGILDAWTKLSNAPKVTLTTEYVTIGGPENKPVGGGSTSENSGGGIGGPNSNSSANKPGFRINNRMYGGYIKKMALGGYVGGTGMTDKVPAMLTPGEFVVNRAAAKRHGPLLQNLNNSAYPSMAGGNGLTSSNYKQPGTANISAPTISSTTSVNNNSSNLYNYNVGINVTKSDANPNDIARSVIDQIKFVDSQRIRGRK